jgi:uncharacterized small protein (DUF1192 family)
MSTDKAEIERLRALFKGQAQVIKDGHNEILELRAEVARLQKQLHAKQARDAAMSPRDRALTNRAEKGARLVRYGYAAALRNAGYYLDSAAIRF